MRRAAAIIGVLALVGALLFLILVPVSTLDAPERHGPPAVVTRGSEARLWVLTKQQERRQVSVGFGRFSTGAVRTDTYFHFDLQAYDARSTEPVWQRRLATIGDRDAIRSRATTSRVVGHSARARILGRDGETVWLFVHDRPVGVAAVDGAPRVDHAAIEARNPGLKGVIPEELGFFAFDGGLVIVAADGRRMVLRGPAAVAAPYTPANDERQADFLTRQGVHDGRWLGLLREREAGDAANDEFGDKLQDISRVVDEGSTARRGLWSARIGRTRGFTEGVHDRLTELARHPGTPEFLQGGFLVRAGTRQALVLDDPRGLLVLHRTRLDAQGRVALSRLDARLAEAWRATRPLAELTHRWEWPGHLLLYGAAPAGDKDGPRGRHECAVAVDLRDGALRAWNVTTGSAVR